MTLDAPRPADREAALLALAGAARRLPDRVLAHGPASAAAEPEVARTRGTLDAVRGLLDDRSTRVRAAAAVALAVAGDAPGPLDARLARERDPQVRTSLTVAAAVVRGGEVLLPGVSVEALVEQLFDRGRDALPWASGFRATLAARALVRLGPAARAAGVERLLATLSEPDVHERVIRAGHLALLALPPDRPLAAAPDREPPDPATLDPERRRALTAIATLDAGGPQVGWTWELLEGMRCAGLPESTLGLRRYLGLVPPAGMEVHVTVRGERVPLFLACKRVALRRWSLDEVVAAVAAHPDPDERALVCATFNPWQYELAQTHPDPAPDAPPPDGVGWDGVPLAAGASAAVGERLLARARAAAAELAAGRGGGLATTALVALTRLQVPLGPELDPLVARACRGVMRAWLARPRELLAALPLARREALVLGLPATPPRGLGPRGSGYAWDLADLAPTPAVAAHLRAGLAAAGDLDPEVAASVAATLARVEAG